MSPSPFTTATIMTGTLSQLLTNDPTFSIIIAGMAGGAVRWQHKREPWRVGIGSVVIGGICATYLGPFTLGVVSKVTGVTITDEAGTTGAFLMGLGGVLIVKLILDRLEAGAGLGSDE